MKLSSIVFAVLMTLISSIGYGQEGSNEPFFTTTCAPTIQACTETFGKDFVYAGATRTGCSADTIRTRCRNDTKITAASLAAANTPRLIPPPPLPPSSAEHEALMVTNHHCFMRELQTIETVLECQSAGEQLGLTFFPEASIPVAVSNARVKEGCTLFENPASGKIGVTFKNDLECRRDGKNHPCLGLSCNHDNPCICFDDTPEPNPVCKDGVFQPDPNKYYTIGSINNRFLATTRHLDPKFLVLTPDLDHSYVPHQDDLTPYSAEAGFTGGNAFDPKSFHVSDARLHWRFIPKGNGKFEIVGRANGNTLLRQGWFLDPRNDNFTSSQNIQFTPRCEGSMVVLAMPEGRQAMDCCDRVDQVYGDPLLSTSNPDTFAAKSQVYAEPKSPGLIRRTKQLVAPLNSMKVEHRWYIHELTEFVRPGKFDPIPVTIDPLFSEAQIADHLASQGESLEPTIAEGVPVVAGGVTVLSDDVLKKMKVGPPFASAALTFGLSFGLESIGVGGGIFGGGDNGDEIDILELTAAVEQALQKLADDLIARTDDLVETEIIEESARLLGNNMIARRRWFIEQYPKIKHFEIAGQNLAQIDNVADRLLREVDDYHVDIETFHGLSFAPTTENAKRSHFMLNTLKLAVTELMVMEQEALLLKAYAQPEVPCPVIVGTHSLDENARFMSNLLSDAQDTLIKFTTEGRQCEVDDGYTTTVLPCSDDTKERFIAETIFDIQRFSYPIHHQLGRLGDMVSDTLNKCERLRDPGDTFRSEFETDEFDFGEGRSEG